MPQAAVEAVADDAASGGVAARHKSRAAPNKAASGQRRGQRNIIRIECLGTNFAAIVNRLTTTRRTKSSEGVMHTTILKSFLTVCLTTALLTGAACAEPDAPAEPKAPSGPEAPVEEKMTAASVAKSFVGKVYEGSLSVEGWTNLGGGLVSPPIYVHHYQREDGTFLVLTSKQTGRGSYVVADALIVAKLKKGYQFIISCTQGKDHTLRFMAEASGRDAKEWWSNLRRAWEISLETGEITKVKNKGIKCTNPAW
jgi:hypothetical protein